MSGLGRFRCRPVFWRVFIMCLMAISAIALILSFLILYPGISEGPDKANYLKRGQCLVTNITYVDNWCRRDTSDDVFVLIYQEDWFKCLLPMIESKPVGINKTCHWKYSDYFTDETEAFIEVSKRYQVGHKYECVIDVVRNICYPDKDEVVFFISVVTTCSIVFTILVIIYCILKRDQRIADEKIDFHRKKKKDSSTDVEKNSGEKKST